MSEIQTKRNGLLPLFNQSNDWEFYTVKTIRRVKSLPKKLNDLINSNKSYHNKKYKSIKLQYNYNDRPKHEAYKKESKNPLTHWVKNFKKQQKI